MDRLDVAVIGAGAAGSFAAYKVKSARPDLSVGLFERADRVGGRLWSVQLPDIDRPIELGGMRLLTNHRRVKQIVEELSLPTHPFDETSGLERSFLRGHFGSGPSDPSAGAAYELATEERGRSATDLVLEAFEAIVPNGRDLDDAGWVSTRHGARFRDRPLVDWPIGEALREVVSPEAVRFISDAFGYDSGIRAFNVGDAIPYLLGGGDPSATAVSPEAGMQSIPIALVRQFVDSGGQLQLEHELQSLAPTEDRVSLRFANSAVISAKHVILALAVPALETLFEASPSLPAELFGPVVAAVESFPAFKLYLGFDRPWWRPGFSGLRLTTDLPPRKIFYRDSSADRPAALLAAYTDGLHTDYWASLANGVRSQMPVATDIVHAARDILRVTHPEVPVIPAETSSAAMHWGADAHETGWTFWRPGITSDDVISSAAQPDESLPIYICGEAYSHAQAWVEGALESAESAVQRVLARA